VTERIYYTDAYCAAFDAVVTHALRHDGRPAALLDRTAFYPTSGGQPHDVGTLGAARVLDVIDAEDGGVVHVLDAAIPAGTAVRGEIDWERRFDHMQQHTGQHVLSAAFVRASGNRTVSFHMSADASTIDLAAEATPESIAAAEREANRVVWEDRPVTVRFASDEEATALPLRKEPARKGRLRLIEVADCDLSACGGTHVARSGAIGVIAVSAWERLRGGTRVTFVCGGRALRLFRLYRDAVAGSTRSLSVLPDELPSAIDRLQNEARDLRRTVKVLQGSLASYEAARMVADTPPSHGVRVVVRALDGWDAAGLKSIAVAAAAAGSTAVALFSTDRPAVGVVARSAGVAVDAQAVLRELMQQFGGKGGGKPDLAQGGGLDAEPDPLLAAARAAIVSRLGDA
jgi:alanyl-tRNA synthetase